MDNPFTRDFGIEPPLMIRREEPLDTILKSFTADTPVSHIFLLTGVRGSGKTVMMTSIENRLNQESTWSVVSLNVLDEDLLSSLAEYLDSHSGSRSIRKSARINLRAVQIEVAERESGSEAETMLRIEKRLESLRRAQKRLLVTIDEVENIQSVRKFASTFQILIRKKLPIFLLMTGLYDKIHALQNEKSLTFLLRAPTIHLKALSRRAIENKYLSSLHISYKDANTMANLTKGFSFAFQILGYYTYEHNGHYSEAMDDFWLELSDHIYDKIWEEMSPLDRKLSAAIANTNSGRISDIMEQMAWTNGQLSPYRKRLIDKGIAMSSRRGEIEFALPMFDRFVLEMEQSMTKLDSLCPRCGAVLPAGACYCPACGERVFSEE